MRRRKKILKNLLKIIIIVAILVVLFFIFKPKKKISTLNDANSNSDVLNVTTINEPNIQINLPTEIKDTSTNKSTNKTEVSSNTENNVTEENKKTYEPLVEVSERYLIPILANNTVTVLVGDDSKDLIPNSSPVSVGNEYTVSGIEETITSVYYFTIDGYSYPILLLLSQTGKLYYIDIESAYLTGKFNVSGYIKDVTNVKNVYQTTVKKDGKEYRSAVIVDNNDIGYEFNTTMIGR